MNRLRTFSYFLLELGLSITTYEEVVKATSQPSLVKPLVKQLAELRKIALAILFAVLAFYIRDGRTVAAGWIVAFILLTWNISSLYDGIDHETFQMRVQAIGPGSFTLLNALPGFVVRIILAVEVINTSHSTTIGIFLVIIMSSPGLLQIIGNAFELYDSYVRAANSIHVSPA